MELAQGLVVADRFRLVRPLGQGGMGAVWLAQHTGLDVPCAVKFIHDHAAQSPDLRARFEREAKAAAQIRSPYVVQILDHGVWQGAPYIAMEYLDGEDLGQRLRRRGPLSPRETHALAVQVGRALSKAHGAGLVHRDLKPANIFIVRDEDREIAKVLDFGVAKVQETGLDGATKTDAVLGTPFYMSPEQTRGSKKVDHRSDLWALAVVVFRCLTGRLPFTGEGLGDLFVKIIVEPLPVPSQIAPVPPGFDGWWERAASRDPAQRFQTAKEFSDALGVALGVAAGDGLDMGTTTDSTGRPSAMVVMGMAPLGPSGTIAMTPSQPGTPHPGGPPTPQPAEAVSLSGSTLAHTTPYSSGAAVLPTPIPMQQSLALSAAPSAPRSGLIAVAVAGVLALGAVGAFFTFHSRATPAEQAPAAAPPAPEAAPPPAPTAAHDTEPTPMVTAAPPPSVAAAPSAKASTASASPKAAARAVARPAAAPPASKPKTDFGF